MTISGKNARSPHKFQRGFSYRPGLLQSLSRSCLSPLLLLCLLCLPLPALAGENIVWNGPGASGNTGELRNEANYWGDNALFPDGPSGNKVTVNGDVPGAVLGGIDYQVGGATALKAANNSVQVNSGTIGRRVIGGFAWNESGTATATATATGNSINISGGTMNAGVIGGYASGGLGNATATGNSVNISGGTFGLIHGGVAAGYFGPAAATDNSISISGGRFSERIFGGEASSAFGPAAATGNSVSISGGTFSEKIYGGLAASSLGAGAAPATATATGNRVTLSGSPIFGASSGVYGGFVTQDLWLILPGVGDAFTGNVLNIWNYTGNAVSEVVNFQYYNFILPATMQSGGTLFTAGNVYFNDSMNSTGSRASTVSSVDVMGGGAPVQSGYGVTLMEYTNAFGALTNGNAVVQGKKGISLLYDWQLAQTATALTATVIGGPRLNPRTKAFSEGRLAGLAFVNQGGDLVAGAGMDAARHASGGASHVDGYGLTPFIVGQGGSSRYDTGSHVDIDGFSLMAGLAWNGQTDYGKLLDKVMIGAFFEAGWGNYDSHNSFSNYASVKGDGDTAYYGGGVLGRFEFPVGRTGSAAAAQRSEPETTLSGEAGASAVQDVRPSVIYMEASFRAGWSETDFSSSDLRDPMGNTADYDSGSAYYGAHLGLGYVWSISESSSLDLYTKYFWTHQDSDSVSVTGDPVKFKSADSHRWRGGARFGYGLTTDSGLTFTPYIGAAYEHEFDGEAKATAYGYSLDSPDLKGGTGMGELGFTLKPAASSGPSFDLGVQGYTGVREGVTGSFQLKWEF